MFTSLGEYAVCVHMLSWSKKLYTKMYKMGENVITP